MAEDEKLAGGDDNLSPEQKADKETKKYLNVMKIVQSVVGGEQNLRPKKKVQGDVTALIVAELFAEEEKNLKESVKLGLKELLKKHVDLEVEVSKKEKELKDLQLKKRKEFTQAANTWLQKVDQSEVMKESYGLALKTAFEAPNEDVK